MKYAREPGSPGSLKYATDANNLKLLTGLFCCAWKLLAVRSNIYRVWNIHIQFHFMYLWYYKCYMFLLIILYCNCALNKVLSAFAV